MRSKHVQITSGGTSSTYNIDGSDGSSLGPTVIAMDSADIENPSAVGIPAWATSATIVAEAIDWRYRSDGGTLSASVGHPIYKEVSHVIRSRVGYHDFMKFKFKQMTGSGAILNITFTDDPSDKFGQSVIIS